MHSELSASVHRAEPPERAKRGSAAEARLALLAKPRPEVIFQAARTVRLRCCALRHGCRVRRGIRYGSLVEQAEGWARRSGSFGGSARRQHTIRARGPAPVPPAALQPLVSRAASARGGRTQRRRSLTPASKKPRSVSTRAVEVARTVAEAEVPLDASGDIDICLLDPEMLGVPRACSKQCLGTSVPPPSVTCVTFDTFPLPAGCVTQDGHRVLHHLRSPWKLVLAIPSLFGMRWHNHLVAARSGFLARRRAGGTHACAEIRARQTA